jgi:hypothetical protein
MEESDETEPLEKTKKPRTEKQIEAFQKAQQKRVENAKLKNEKIALIKSGKDTTIPEPVKPLKPKPKPIVEEEEEEDEIVVVKKKKKKPKVIYVEESESEDDAPVVVKRKKPTPATPQPMIYETPKICPPLFKINFLP